MALLPVVVVQAIYATATAMGLTLAVVLWRGRHRVRLRSRPGNRVEVGIGPDGTDSVTVFLADNGVGIPDDDGTGLGLAIVEQIASAHGWEVGATHGDAGGARFEIHGVARPVTVDIEG